MPRKKKKLTCPECGSLSANFKSPQELGRHRRRVHDIEGSSPSAKSRKAWKKRPVLVERSQRQPIPKKDIERFQQVHDVGVFTAGVCAATITDAARSVNLPADVIADIVVRVIHDKMVA